MSKGCFVGLVFIFVGAVILSSNIELLFKILVLMLIFGLFYRSPK